MGTERRTFHLGIAAALTAGLVLRLWFVYHAPVRSGDALIYSAIARNLLLHGVYGFNQHTTAAGQLVIEPTLIRLPGYPLFLAAVFRLFGLDDYRAVLYIQVLADLLTCVLTAAIARRIFGIRAGLLVVWLAALCPFTANYTAVPLTETLVLLTIALALYALCRWVQAHGGWNRWVWIVAAGVACSILLRPEQGLLAAALIPPMLWFQLQLVPDRAEIKSPRGIASESDLPNAHSRVIAYETNDKPAPIAPAARLAHALPVLTVAVCVLLPLVPWTIRNWRTFHRFQPLAPRSATDPGEPPSPGFNHWYRTWAMDFTTTDTVYWNINGDRIDPADLPNRAFADGCMAPPAVPRNQLPFYSETVGLLAAYNRTTFDPPALDARFASLARRRAAAEPLCNFVLLPLARVANMLFRPRLELLPVPDQWWDRTTHPAQRRFALTYAALNLAYLALGIWGVARWVRDSITVSPIPVEATLVLLASIAVVVLRLALLLTLDNSEPRYTLELFPILFLWSAATVSRPVALSKITPQP
jgi:hypothetical protein